MSKSKCVIESFGREGVNDEKLREYLIDVDNLTLASCIQKSKQYVSHHEHVKKMEVTMRISTR